MTKTLIVVGFGPGISSAVADKFGAEGFQVALVGRTAERLAAGVARLESRGVKAAAFVADAGSPDAMRDVVARVRASLGPITAVQWTAYGQGAGDLTVTDDAALRNQLDVGVVSLTATVQAALPDLKAQQGAVLITNGGLGAAVDAVDQMGVQWNAMGLSVVNAAKHKLARLLAAKLAPDGVFVGEVTVNGTVKGTAWDSGQATIEPATIGDRFWALYEGRKERWATVA